MTEYLITFMVGVFGSAISSMCGAGAGLLTSPCLILLGLPPQTAVATAKFGGIGITLGSLSRFRTTEHIRKEYVVAFMIVSGIASCIGVWLLLTLPAETVRTVVACAALFALVPLCSNKMGVERFETTKTRQRIGYVCKLCTESIQAAFGAGLGILTSLVVIFFFGFTALEANATKRIPGLVKEFIAIPWLVAYGLIAYDYGIALILGSLVGGYTGAHVAIKKGNVFVKIALVVVVAITASKILIDQLISAA